ncbi:hypothetical protein AB895_3178 [Acinetobacter baumannii]|nr:hypothetical protein J514_3154 [Acinetobacter sp. 1396970]EXB22129.1 hypothetical protein J518_4281 [Acinetobacter baumannii 1419130]EXE76681.1 hypothetical protein J582_2345 [Acinetobacter sp. 1566109]EXE96089.1 hypothetical protein J594_3744 [Acinetobacter sp. 259052]EYT19573.1 hypothetical protein J595_01092 [Acinetobacter sp. 1592897]KCY22157.1 hypothetical protein J635_2229 [Acinetobacter baumannii 233846]KMV07048.1 hypothetical protein AB895_3178 [Acinetobacter baumannii]
MEDFIKLINWCLKEMNEMKAWRFVAILITLIICTYLWKM